MAKKEVYNYTVLRDTNEHANKGWIFHAHTETATSVADVKTVQRNLFTGDYSLEGYYDNKLFVIERKGCVAEYVKCITKKDEWRNFKDELGRLEEFSYPFVICEFPFSCLYSFPQGSGIPERLWDSIRIKPSFLLRRTEEIFLHFKTRFLFTDTQMLGQQIASGLFKRMIEHVPTPPT